MCHTSDITLILLLKNFDRFSLHFEFSGTLSTYKFRIKMYYIEYRFENVEKNKFGKPKNVRMTYRSF